MNKKNKITIIIVFFLGIISIYKLNFNNGYKVSILNNTNKNINNLELKYKIGDKIKTISEILPKKYWKYTIDTNKIEGENAVILIYKDSNGKLHEEYIIGYLEKGYSGSVKIIINKVYDNGELNIEIK